MSLTVHDGVAVLVVRSERHECHVKTDKLIFNTMIYLMVVAKPSAYCAIYQNGEKLAENDGISLPATHLPHGLPSAKLHLGLFVFKSFHENFIKIMNSVNEMLLI